jgi:hypothetical protein
MVAIQATRELAAVRACNICVLIWLSPIESQHPGMAGRPKLTNSRTSSGLISGID